MKFKSKRSRVPRDFPDVQEFEHALCGASPVHGDFSPHFNGAGSAVVVRAPARLDVMGGISDCCGSLVCELPLGQAVILALQKRKDRRVRVYSPCVAAEGGAPSAEVLLDDLYERGKLKTCDRVAALFRRDPRTAWVAHVAGAFYALVRENCARAFDVGADIVITSTIPSGTGLGASAAVEVAALHALNIKFGLKLDGHRLARLAQFVENQIVGKCRTAMDQIATAMGKPRYMLAIRCQPDRIAGSVPLPAGWCFLGVNSKAKRTGQHCHYTDVRVNALMAHRIILAHLEHEGVVRRGADPYGGYLCNIRQKEFAQRYEPVLPNEMKGCEFLSKYGQLDDPVARVEPDKMYRVKSRAGHVVYENERVQEFLEWLDKASLLRRPGDEEDDEAIGQAGQLMYASHWSYRTRCGLDSLETNLLVRLIRNIGLVGGLFGAKITSGGSGGTVAVLGREQAIMPALEKVVATYESMLSIKPEIFAGTSPGALDFGHLEYEPV